MGSMGLRKSSGFFSFPFLFSFLFSSFSFESLGITCPHEETQEMLHALGPKSLSLKLYPFHILTLALHSHAEERDLCSPLTR